MKNEVSQIESWMKRITEWRPPEVRMIGRLQSRWGDYVRADLGKIKIQNWNKIATDREARKRNAE
jgi:hypothetical protein